MSPPQPSMPGAEPPAARLAAMTHDLLAAVSIAERRLVWSNPAWYRLLGWTGEELAATPYDRFVHPEDLEALKRAEAALVEGRSGDRPEIDVRMRGSDGAYRRLAFSATHSPADGLAFVSGRDVTARRREDEDLRSAGERYRALTDSTHDAVVSADINGRIIFWNPGAEAIFGYSAAEALGQPLSGLMPERYRDAHRAGMARYLATGVGRLMGSTVEVEGLRADGSEFPLELTLATWTQSGRRCFTGVLRDVSERARARHEVRAAALIRAPGGEPQHFVGQVEDAAERRELERSNAELEHFAYVASHDLSEPLRMVSSHLQLLRRRYHGRLDADADQLIDHAVDGAAHMRDLIDDLLRYSRAGRGEHPFEPVDTAAVAERAAEAARAQAEGADVRIAIGSLPTVRGDAQELGQVFQNLIGNAVKFVPDGRAPEVQISAERDGPEWRFTVADNGIGLQPRDADRVFRMFERLHAHDEYRGTGIGLGIARKVVERHGGRIWAEPRPEGGSRFCFTLPAEG